MGSHSQQGGSRTLSGGGFTDKLTKDESDTANSPSKPRWSSSKCYKGGLKLVDKIKSQREEEEKARKVRESAFDAGLIGHGGTIAPGAEHIVLHDFSEPDVRKKISRVSLEISQSLDLNSEPIDEEGLGSEVSAK